MGLNSDRVVLNVYAKAGVGLAEVTVVEQTFEKLGWCDWSTEWGPSLGGGKQGGGSD